VCCSVVQCVHNIRTTLVFIQYALQFNAVCCSIIQCVAVCCSLYMIMNDSSLDIAHCSVLQCAAARCSVLQYGAVCKWYLNEFVFRHYKRHLHARDLQKQPIETYKNDCQISRFENSNDTFVRVCHDLFICIHMHDVTHSYLWRESYVCVTWLVYMCSMTHSCVLRDLFNYASWLIRMRDMTRLYVCHDSFI